MHQEEPYTPGLIDFSRRFLQYSSMCFNRLALPFSDIPLSAFPVASSHACSFTLHCAKRSKSPDMNALTISARNSASLAVAGGQSLCDSNGFLIKPPNFSLKPVAPNNLQCLMVTRQHITVQLMTYFSFASVLSVYALDTLPHFAQNRSVCVKHRHIDQSVQRCCQ